MQRVTIIIAFGDTIKYIFVDGVCFAMRVNGSIENVPVLVAIGVMETGQRIVLGLQAGDKESASSWREFFKDFKARGLDGRKVTLGVMDGLTGLEKVFGEDRAPLTRSLCRTAAGNRPPRSSMDQPTMISSQVAAGCCMTTISRKYSG